jgi:hypothetical protein
MSALQVIPSATRLRGIRLVIVAVIAYTALHIARIQNFFAADSEGLGALLEIIGTLYSVVYAFATYVIWEQFAAVENAILRESGALKDLVLFSRRIDENGRDPIVRAAKAYARGVVESEWPLLSNGRETDKTNRLFAGVISSVLESKPANESEERAYESLIEIARQVSAHRDERLAVSAKRIPRTLLFFVSLTALTILLLLLLFPFHSLALGALSMAIATMLLFLAHFVLTDLDNPFEGTWNVTNQPFAELVTDLR